ncbi:hypothetical protein [Dietzia psychralcaliphila]|uniref:Uncharacterized protein n=1 Tax=Dietzia psychralcaliphila TaxID=139021 RepID=A0AAD0NMG5_9ACTN|nr:hypothetical protein [Dietzia psychralcaliphila]AWH95200.1 hypothetical protein A6048_06565 [Dietzia psychralcaliphila]PTM87441.1 hypothetical protein C8N39_105273 [Dietzia psychralcaliphila]
MPTGAERPLDQALAETVELVESALQRAAPIQGVFDLHPFDHSAAGLTHRRRREIALEQLPAAIPLPFRPDAKPDEVAPRLQLFRGRRVVLWALFVLTVASAARPELSLFFGVAWLVALIWPRGSGETTRTSTRTPQDDAVGGGHATEIELRIIWMARWQAAAIVRTRAWRSEELAAGVGRIDVSSVLGNLTERALSLYRFTSTAPPMPSRSQPELRHQWQREQQRIGAIRAELVEHVAALIVYREHLDLISDLLDQRDLMAVYSERAAAFDDVLPPSPEGPVLLDATTEQRDLHSNLASQLQYLSAITDGSGTALPLCDSAQEL